MTRQSYSGRPPEDWQLAQRLTVDQALRLFTVDAAYGTFEENVKGSLTSGKVADLVVLSDDPTTVPVDSLLDIQLLATVVGGRVEYCSDPSRCRAHHQVFRSVASSSSSSSRSQWRNHERFWCAMAWFSRGLVIGCSKSG